MKKILAVCSLFFITTVLSACANIQSAHGTKIERSQVDFIQKGVTTRTEVEEKLGKPTTVTIAGNGGRVAMYSYYEMNVGNVSFGLAKMRTIQGSLQVIYSKDNVVMDYKHNQRNSTTLVDSFGGRREVKEE